MSSCDGCTNKDKCNGKENCLIITPRFGKIKNIIGVISGKGGVGKSTVTGILAVELSKAGFKVGVLDADITGPSIPRFFGIENKRAQIVYGENKDEFKFVPVETSSKIKVISLNLLTDKEEQPVIWRGPVISGALRQMFSDTVWGDLDYLLIDMPPGTGDTALTVMQSFNVDGMVIVSTPQDMVSMIVKKVVIMCQKLKMNIFGVIENLSYIKCSKCGEKIKVFSKRSAEDAAKYLDIPLLSELPISVDLADAMEKGEVEKYIIESGEYSQILNGIIK